MQKIKGWLWDRNVTGPTAFLYVRYADGIKQVVIKRDEDKITFNTDYRWNVENRNDLNILDWQTPKRIIEFAEKHSLNNDFLEKILFRNGEKFFKIED